MNVITFEYNSAYSPTAPFVDIEVDGYNEALGKRTLSAMVDSGADATMLPLSILEAIGAFYKDSMWMRGSTGGRIEVDLYLVAIRIGSNLIRGLHVVGIPNSNETIIGRDVLNQLIVTLNGHASVTEIVVD
jgi:hypothetical protein